MIAIGSRGDVWPYMALGVRLQQMGHTVKIATHGEFETQVQELGLGFLEIGGNPRAMLESEAGQRWLSAGSNVIAHMRFSSAAVRPLLEDRARDIMKACLGAEAVIHSPMGFAASHFAERLGIPCFGGDGVPMYRSRHFPSPLVNAGRPILPPINWLSHLMVDQFAWQQIRQGVNAWRTEDLDLPPIGLLGPAYRRDHIDPLFLCYSSRVFPVPRDWPSWWHVTGSWFLDPPADFVPPSDVVEFLADGPPPVWVGFGSMVARDAERLTDLVVKALRMAGKRGILQSGWGGLGERLDGKDMLGVRSVEHHWLFPQVAAVVHHGGGGTTAAGLRAGAPSILTPFFADQPFWGQRVRKLGVGPAPIPHQQLTAEKLAVAIKQATGDEGIRRRAAALGAAIRAEDGVGKAAAIFESYVEKWTDASAGAAI